LNGNVHFQSQIISGEISKNPEKRCREVAQVELLVEKALKLHYKDGADLEKTKWYMGDIPLFSFMKK